MKVVLKYCGVIIFKMMGWKYEDLPGYWTGKHVIIGFPHTSNMDTFRAFTYMKIVNIKGHILVKKSWFFWPMSVLLASVGGIPVDRNKSAQTVSSVAEKFKSREKFIVSIVPEGTRKNVSKLKTGFWYIAKEAGVSILCWHIDNKNKTVRWAGMIHPGDSIENDLLKIKMLYKKQGLEIPYNGDT